MNRQQTKNILASVQIHGVEMEHFANGGDIEYLEDGNLWQEANQPSFDPNLRYRKKPATTYRPYNLEESLKQVGRVVKLKAENDEAFIVVRFIGGVFVVNGGKVTPEIFLEQFEHLDGSPCGVKEGE